jgi:hypothetical protein
MKAAADRFGLPQLEVSAASRTGSFSRSSTAAFIPFVPTAFMADLWRAAAPRCLALVRACFDNDRCEAALRPCCFKAPLVTRERFADGLRREWLCPFS